MLRYVSSTLFLQNVYPEGLLIFSKVFSVSAKVTVWFRSLRQFVWGITFIYLHILKHFCIPEIKPTWSWWMTPQCFQEFGLPVFCWEFLHLCSAKRLVYNLHFVVSLSGFTIMTILDSSKEFGNVSSFPILWSILRSVDTHSFECLIKSVSSVCFDFFLFI